MLVFKVETAIVRLREYPAALGVATVAGKIDVKRRDAETIRGQT